MKRKILLGLLVVLVIIQFFRPARNLSSEASANDIAKHYSVPADVQESFKKACNDCHTNNTIYPWYYNIQPVAWWMNWHINEGKEHLDFSEFSTYSPKKQHHKLEEVIEMVKEGEMPLPSYTWIHKDAILTHEEKVAITSWAEKLRTEIAGKHSLPPDEKE